MMEVGNYSRRRYFERESYPPELEVLGKQIAKECCRLPLTIVVIHLLSRGHAVRDAEEEKFLQEIKGSVHVPTQNKYRRLCIHSQVLEYISSKPSGPHV
ncbi:hypothetical protein U1Q18_001989 [Sarracenia purpurea var. burkii]